MALDNLNDLVYVNISNTSSQKCPINSSATPCIICKEKCKLSFSNAYFQATCGSFVGGIVYSNLTTTTTSYLTFNENNFSINALYILVPPINTYSKNELFCELVIESMSDYGYLIIYIPILVSKTTTLDILPDLKGPPTQSLSNINLYNYLPSQKPFYFYNAFYKKSRSNYIIFPPKSCNVTISSEDYQTLWEITKNAPTNPVKNPSNDYFTLFKGSTNPIYYNETGANITDSNDYYLDCRVSDYEDIEDAVKDHTNGDTPMFNAQVPSSQSMSNFLVFIAIAVACMLLYLLVINIPKIIN